MVRKNVIRQLQSIAICRKQEGEYTSTRSSTHWRKRTTEIPSLSLVALLPVWNAERYLNETLNELAKSVDAVIALDDGSEDDTLRILTSNPIVIEVIQKPHKNLSEWNDAQNRYELYLAAEKYHPQWVIAVDADERLEQTFKIFKSSLLGVESSLKAFAFHIAEIDGNFIIRKKFAHRMYRYKVGYSFDNKRLHCRLLPLEITIDEIRLVNIRLLHLADESARRFRFDKYQQADGDLTYQSSYKHLLGTFLHEDLEPIGGHLIISRVVDDGLQRRLRVRKIHQFDRILTDETKIQQFIKKVYSELTVAEKVFTYFFNAKLDAYLIEWQSKGELTALYSYDSAKDVKVTEVEAWLIEEMHHHRDFFLTIAKFYLISKLESVSTTTTQFLAVLVSLTEKNIIKI